MSASKLLGVITGMILPVAMAFLPASGQSEPEPSPERIADNYDAKAEMLEAVRAGLRLEAFSVSARASTIAGQTPDAIRDWVSGHVVLIPYRGVLKGAAGALEDGRANSLDRALLLAGLLAETGASVRLARATIDGDTAKALLAAAGGIPPAAPQDTAAADAALEKLYADPRVDGARIRARVDAQMAANADRFARANERAARVATSLGALAAGVLKTGPADDEAATLTDHWWVQIEEAGVWRDLDPSASLVGSLAAAETHAIDAVPEDLFHTVRIGLIAEYWQDGAYNEQTVFSHDFKAAAAYGRLISVRHRALGAPSVESIAALEGGLDANIVAVSATNAAWAPLVLFGDEAFSDKLAATDGTVIEATPDNLMAHGGDPTLGGPEALARAAGGMLGGLEAGMDGAEPYDENAGPVRMTAEFLEIAINGPGDATRVERRVLFDAVGAAGRSDPATAPEMTERLRADRALALRDRIDVMVLGGRVTSEHAEGRMSEAYAAALRAGAAYFRSGSSDPMPAPEDFRDPNLILQAFAVDRMTFGAEGDSRQIVSANVVMTRGGLRISDDGAVADVAIFDIVANAVRAPHAAAALAAGVADTVAEHEAIGSGPNSRNAAQIYDEALSRGESWTLVAPGDAAALAALDLDPQSRALIAADLARNYAVVVPARIASASEAAWWRIDPASGETLGMLAAGGAAVSEEAILNANIAMSVINAISCDIKTYRAVQEAGGHQPSNAKKASIAMCFAGAIFGVVGTQAGVIARLSGIIGGGISSAGPNLFD